MPSPNPDAKLQRVFPGDSEIAQRLRQFDWSTSELGTPDTWPEALRTAVAICITSRFPMHVWWGPDLKLFYNDAYIKLLGLKKHPSVLAQSGRTAWPEVWDRIRPMIDRVFSHGEANWSEDTPMSIVRELPKEEVFVTFSFSPIYGASGSVEGLFCACTETTAKVVGARRLETLRKLSTSQARTLEETCQTIANVLGENREDVPCVALYLFDRTSWHLAARVRFDEGEAGFGATLPDACRGLDELTELPVELGPRRWPEPITRVVAVPVRGTRDTLIGMLICGVSPRRPLDASYETFFKLAASHVGSALTHARAKEDERRRLDALAELDRAKTQFFSNISHEFRTPLTLMLAPLEDLLARSDDLTAGLREPLEMIQRNAVRLQKLVNNLLDFSTLEAGRAQMMYEPVLLSTLTADVASAFRSTIEHAGLRFDVECEPLADAVYVDLHAWEKIVLNLISNAYKHTFEGGITVSLKRAGDHVQLAVRDTGVGIAGTSIPHLFERFHRVEGQRSRSHEGSGIGLALVHDLVRLHGGAISADSAPGVGSTFSVMIPLGHAHLPAEQTRHASSTPRDPKSSDAFVSEAMTWSPGSILEERSEETDRPHVLLVEDNPDMRAYVTKLLEPDCIVDAVDNGLTALDIIRRSPPDLVLTDVMMPGIDGLDLVREIRANPVTQHMPTIVLSARADEQARVDGLAAGADDVIVKPFSGRELRARVQTQLELATARLQVGNARAASRAKDDFLALFGHELRNPLSAVFTSLQVLQRRAPSPEVELMDRAIRHLTRLVDDLLDLSRLHRGRIPLHRRQMELAQIVDLALERLAPQIAGRQTQVFVSVARSGLLLDCDPERIAQVLANVLSNAAKYSEPGSKVTVAAERSGDRIRLVVRDQGAGIEPSRLASVFDAFQDRSHGAGLGLGLAIARNLVELHGGAIQLASNGIGCGTECVIELPADVLQTGSSPEPTEKRERKRVLLVEDNHDTAIALQRALESLGYKVALAHNGPVALTVARSFQPDVALVDIGLPVMDGWELANRLRQLHVPSRTLHVVAVTARDQDADKQRSTEAGFAEHLVKPIDLDRLQRVVENLPDPAS